MERAKEWIPASLIAAGILAMIWHGPVAQPAGYNDFADKRTMLGIPNALDVLSNAPFLIVGLWGFQALRGKHHDLRIARSWPGFAMFLVAITLTAFGSGYYHWAPDNQRLLWDRLPIALACAGLLAAVHTETHRASPKWLLAVLVVASVASCLWWYATDAEGAGDLRPYLFFQLALVLVPVWQWIDDSPRPDRIVFGIAVVLYALAKVFEIYDKQTYEALKFVSGHTIKHLLAAAAAMLLAANLVRRIRAPDSA
jgi:predicted membrane channel-forming protein YqfA (hemolysin III family)